MTLQPRIRKPLLAAVLAAFAASTLAAYNSSMVPGPAPEPSKATSEAPPPEAVTTAQEAPATTEVATPLALEPNETVVAVEERPAVPVVERSVAAEPAIEITKPRLTPDQRIQADVIDLLARNPNLSGQIGVVSEDRVVTLTGWTTTSGQAWRAGRDARGVEGVRHVVNQIRPRVGGITS